jgi:hypothetical protein
VYEELLDQFEGRQVTKCDQNACIMLLGSGLSVEWHNMYYTEKSEVKVRLVLQRVRD